MKKAVRNVGHVDAVEAGFVRGWALQKHMFGKISEVEIRMSLDGSVIASVRANTHRPDLKQQGYGNGNYGFNIRLPEGVVSGGPYNLSLSSWPGGQTLVDGDVTILDGSRMQGGAFAPHQDSFLSIHSALQYESLQRALKDAVKINGDVGAVPAICLLYARILGRMPEARVVSRWSGRHAEASDFVECANEIYFSEEGCKRRGKSGDTRP